MIEPEPLKPDQDVECKADVIAYPSERRGLVRSAHASGVTIHLQPIHEGTVICDNLGDDGVLVYLLHLPELEVWVPLPFKLVSQHMPHVIRG
jgi:hypothetical protein